MTGGFSLFGIPEKPLCVHLYFFRDAHFVHRRSAVQLAGAWAGPHTDCVGRVERLPVAWHQIIVVQAKREGNGEEEKGKGADREGRLGRLIRWLHVESRAAGGGTAQELQS
eukprot:24309-Chlamydomonas_euryale.AAC.1